MTASQNACLFNEFVGALAENSSIQAADLERCRTGLFPLLEWAGETPLSQARAISPSFPAFLASQASQHGSYSRRAHAQAVNLSRRFFQWAADQHSQEYCQVDERFIRSLHLGYVPNEPARREYIELE